VEERRLRGGEKLLWQGILFDDIGDSALEQMTLGVGGVGRVIYANDLPTQITNAHHEPRCEKRADVVDEEDLVLVAQCLLRAHDTSPDPTATVVEQEPVESVGPGTRRGGQRYLGTCPHICSSSIEVAPVDRRTSTEPSAIAFARASASFVSTATTT
jgi:hypothetical protein